VLLNEVTRVVLSNKPDGIAVRFVVEKVDANDVTLVVLSNKCEEMLAIFYALESAHE